MDSDEGPTMVSEEQLYEIHDHSFDNCDEISGSAGCGCFYCGAIFPASAIRKWYETDAERTAACPECDIDSVIGDASGYSIGPSLLVAMHARWF